MSEDDSGLGLKVHEDAYRELERERDEWKAKYIKQNKDLGCEMMDPAGTIWDYASGLQRENVQLKREVDRERALANEAIATWRKTKEERDEARDQRDRLAEAIYKTIMENLHLADGDDCTLKRLKDVIQFELPNE
jgi:predicted  nucleic acid-binding Zn-ribbon protein